MPVYAAVPWHFFPASARPLMDDAAPLIDLYSDDHFMREALRQARRAAAQDEVPIGAIIVHDRIILYPQE